MNSFNWCVTNIPKMFHTNLYCDAMYFQEAYLCPNINELLREKNQLLEQLKSLLFGSIELREKGGKQYIYVHYCLDGVLTTKDGIFLF